MKPNFDQTYNRFGEPEAMSDRQLFRLIARANENRKPRLLKKSIPASVAGKLGLLPRKQPRLIIAKAKPLDDRELLGALSDACARGLISGHDALAAEKLLHAGKPLPAEIRRKLLAISKT